MTSENFNALTKVFLKLFHPDGHILKFEFMKCRFFNDFIFKCLKAFTFNMRLKIRISNNFGEHQCLNKSIFGIIQPQSTHFEL